jgi:hypothetical protein
MLAPSPARDKLREAVEAANKQGPANGPTTLRKVR